MLRYLVMFYRKLPIKPFYLVMFFQRLPVKPFLGTLTKLFKKEYRILALRARAKNKVVRATVNGITYELDLIEMIDRSIYYLGCYEPEVTAIIDKYSKKGMTVLDIGANIGCHTLRFAKMVDKDGKVIAFEPMSYAFLKLKRNIELNDFNNIKLEKLALSNVNEKKGVNFSSSWPLHSSYPELSKKVEEIVFITLDKYVKINKIDRIDFIKLDVDGYEYKVIRGGMDSIMKFRPIMIIEFGKCTLKKFGDSLEDLIDLLISLGYSFFSADTLKKYTDKESILNAVPDVGITINGNYIQTINVICVPKITSKNSKLNTRLSSERLNIYDQNMKRSLIQPRDSFMCKLSLVR